jgi:hypothetical protein
MFMTEPPRQGRHTINRRTARHAAAPRSGPIARLASGLRLAGARRLGRSRQGVSDPIEDVMLTDEDLWESKAGHDPVQDERAATDHVDPPWLHDADERAFGPGLA